MSQYFSSLPSSHLLASPLGQVLLKASRERRFSDVIYKGKSPWHKKDRGWRLHMSEEMVRGWCIPLVQPCSIHFALFRWKNYDNLWPDNQIESRTVTSIHILCWSIIFLSFSWYWVRMRGCGSWTLSINIEHWTLNIMLNIMVMTVWHHSIVSPQCLGW